MKGWILILFLSPWNINLAQTPKIHPGFSFALSMNIGTHTSQVGCKLGTYLYYQSFQLNAGTSYHFSAKNLGNRRAYSESRSYIGAAALFGKQERIVDMEVDGLNHQTAFNGAASYCFIWYSDTKGTSQHSGGFGFGWKQSYIRFENDIFAGQGKDRFRTGILSYSYLAERAKFSTGIILWTGETKSSIWHKEPLQRVPNGYRDLSALPYGTTSHGIAYVSATKFLDFGQSVTMKTGIDSEQIRHFAQNRCLHDLVFLPKFIKRHTPHYPRIGENGQAVFSASERKKDRLYLQVGFGSNWSY